MEIGEALKSQGYEFEYDHGDSEERIEVWINKKAGMALRLEWIRLE